jgi:hypothetical protein
MRVGNAVPGIGLDVSLSPPRRIPPFLLVHNLLSRSERHLKRPRMHGCIKMGSGQALGRGKSVDGKRVAVVIVTR